MTPQVIAKAKAISPRLLTALAFSTASGLAVSTAAMAQDMLKPQSTQSSDMLKPSQVNYEGESSNPANDSGFFVGAGLGFGQAYSTEDGATPGLGLFGKVEPGFQFNRGSWNRIEASVELFSGKLAYRAKDARGGRVDMPVGFGMLAKVGYGYSLGSKVTGLFKLGVGPTFAKYKAKTDAATFESDGSLSGIAGMIGWDMVVPVGSSLDVVGGVSLTHMQFDVGKVSDSQNNKLQIGSSNVNVPQANLGLRVRL